MSDLMRPHTVAIVAMGGSAMDLIGLSSQHGGLAHMADETWGINAMGGILQCDRVFAMDDLADLRAQKRGEKRKVATGMLEWLPRHPGPIYVPRVYPEVPGSVEYPLEDVLNCIGFPYMNNSVAYAVAFAVTIGVKQLKLYGCDFTYPNRSTAEAGRANVEFLLGIAGERGMKVEVSEHTTLLDGHRPMEKRLYGYGEPVIPEMDEEGRWRVRFPEREKRAETRTETAGGLRVVGSSVNGGPAEQQQPRPAVAEALKEE